MKYLKSLFIWFAAAYIVFLSAANTDNAKWYAVMFAYIIGIACIYGIYVVWKSSSQEEKEFMTFAKYVKKYFGWDLFSEE